jgi:hypothetical protein
MRGVFPEKRNVNAGWVKMRESKESEWNGKSEKYGIPSLFQLFSCSIFFLLWDLKKWRESSPITDLTNTRRFATNFLVSSLDRKKVGRRGSIESGVLLLKLGRRKKKKKKKSGVCIFLSFQTKQGQQHFMRRGYASSLRRPTTILPHSLSLQLHSLPNPVIETKRKSYF